MNLPIEDDAHHLVLILNHDYLGSSVIDEVHDLIVNSRVRRFIIHVISSDGRPKYLDKLRPILTSIMSCTLMVRYEGSTEEDFRNLINSLRRDNTTVLIVGGNGQVFEEVLHELGFKYKFLEV
ncbi:MAG: hypothetical protein QXD94_06565 [Sulfolobales archaeon]